MKLKNILIGLFSLVVVLGIVVIGGMRPSSPIPLHDYKLSKIEREDGDFRYYSDRNYDSIIAIDVSYFQGKIDWKKVKKSGVDAAYIRVGYRSKTDGELYLDSTFKRNIEGAKRAGIKVGVYFFSQSITKSEAREDAYFVKKHINDYDIDLEVAFDMEYIGEDCRIRRVDNAARTVMAMEFCDTIESLGYKSLIYGNPTYLMGSLDLEKLNNHDVWLAHYIDVTDYKYKFKVWQYSDSGRISGINHAVDLNIIFQEKER